MKYPDYIKFTKKTFKKDGSVRIKIEGRNGISGEVVLTREALLYGHPNQIKWLKEELIKREEYEYGKNLNEFEFNIYVLKNYETMPIVCDSCHGLKFLYWAAHKIHQCEACKTEYGEDWIKKKEALQSFLRNRYLINEAYKYGRLKSSECVSKIKEFIDMYESILTN